LLVAVNGVLAAADRSFVVHECVASLGLYSSTRSRQTHKDEGALRLGSHT
jgi:hypothetical protein